MTDVFSRFVEASQAKSVAMILRYLNGCKCGEHVEKSINYQGDVASLHELGFDEVKIDGCGKQLNMTYYAELMKATGKS